MTCPSEARFHRFGGTVRDNRAILSGDPIEPFGAINRGEQNCGWRARGARHRLSNFLAQKGESDDARFDLQKGAPRIRAPLSRDTEPLSLSTRDNRSYLITVANFC